MSDCEIDVVVSSTLAGSFFASAGLMVCSALRIVTAASCEFTSTRRAPRAWNTCSWARCAKSRIAVFDRWGGDRRRDGVGDHRAGGGHEVVGAGETQRRLVADVLAHLDLL